MNDDQKSNDVVVSIVSKFTTICQTTEEALNEWHGTGSLHFPKLFGMIAVKLNWGENDLRKSEPIVRYCVQNNPNWVISLGNKGGIMRRTDKEKLETERLAKKSEKKVRRKKSVALVVRPEVMDEIRAEVEARVSSGETRTILTDEDEEEFGELS